MLWAAKEGAAVNFLSFEYVMTIWRAGTIRGAAEELFISAQALSEHLGKLEREIGAPLFHRTKPLTLTEAGQRFVECAETCLEAKKRLEMEVAAITRQNDSHICLGVPTGMPPPLLLSFLNYFRHTHPELTVTTVELPTRTGAFHEIPGHIDVVIGEFQAEESKLVYTPLLRSGRFVVAIHRDLLERCVGEDTAREIERAAGAQRMVELSSFRDCPFVLKRSGSIIRENEDRLFRAANVAVKGDVETGDMELTVRMVLLGQAAVYFPEPVARANLVLPDALAKDHNILLCPVRAPEGEVWQLTAGCHRYRRVPDGVERLIGAAKAYYENMLGSRHTGVTQHHALPQSGK